MNTRLYIVFIFILSFGPTPENFAQGQRSGPTNQFWRSQVAIVRLGVWDRSGEPREYTATFVVTAPSGKQSKAEKSVVRHDGWVYADFPKDFVGDAADYSTYMLYNWKCLVGGKQVANGQFHFGGSSAAAEAFEKIAEEPDPMTPRRETLKRREPANDKIMISGVQVNNFHLKNIANYGDVILLLGGENTIQVDTLRNVFQISIEATTLSGFNKNRDIVETQLLSLLGITRSEACKLQVTETANSPGGWNGKTYGLSFCSMPPEVKPKAPVQSEEWDSFLTVFRAAVKSRDRAALRQMMASSFEYGDGERVNSERVFSELDYGGGENWRVLERTLNRTVQPYKLPNSRRPARVIKNPLPCGKRPCDYTAWAIFELGSDERWRWVSFIFPGD